MDGRDETLEDARRAAYARLELATAPIRTIMHVLDNANDPMVQYGLDMMALLKDAHVVAANLESFIVQLPQMRFHKPH